MSTPRPTDRCSTEPRNPEPRNSEPRNARSLTDSSLATGSPTGLRRWRLSWRRASWSGSPLSGVLGVLLLVSGVACASSGVSREGGAGSAPSAAVESAEEAAVTDEDREPAQARGELEAESAESGTGATEAGAPDEETAKAAAGDGEDDEERQWFVDEQGRAYYIVPVAKEPLKVWRHLDENTVRIPWGLTLELVNEDDDYFYAKRYDVKGIRPPVMNQPPTEEELAAVAEQYRVELPDSDRVTLVPAAEGLPEVGQWRNGFVLADMNGDGHLDLVHGPPRKTLIPPVIFLGDSKGTWRRWKDVRFPSLRYDYGDVAVSDFNRDGTPDLALACHLRGAVVLVGDGQGNFETWSDGIGFLQPDSRRRGRQGQVFTSRTADVVDWNEDGWPDLLLVGEGPRLDVAPSGADADFSPGSFGAAIYLNRGDGSWELLKERTRFGDVYGDSVAVADFDGDGRTDFVTGSNVMGSKEVLNLGREDGTWKKVEIEELPKNSYLRAVRAADFNDDGRPDLAVAYMSFELGVWRSGIDLFLAGEKGFERRGVAVAESRDGIYALDVGDLDGDGHLDLAGLTGQGELWLLLGDGEGGFTREASPEVPPQEGGCRGYHAALVDFDEDGRDELVAAFAGESTLVQMGECPSGGALRAWDVETP